VGVDSKSCFVDLHQGCEELGSELYKLKSDRIVVHPSTSRQANHLMSNAHEFRINTSSLNKTPTLSHTLNNIGINTNIMPNMVNTQGNNNIYNTQEKTKPFPCLLPLAQPNYPLLTT
jgi:hypothetical protein